MMSRKHFQDIACLLSVNKASEALKHEFMLWLALQNPRFDKVKFIEACS